MLCSGGRRDTAGRPSQAKLGQHWTNAANKLCQTRSNVPQAFSKLSRNRSEFAMCGGDVTSLGPVPVGLCAMPATFGAEFTTLGASLAESAPS